MDSLNKVILIIDDEVTIGEMLQDYLETLGFKTFHAPSAEKGLEVIRNLLLDLETVGDDLDRLN